ncbi:MAG: hypothetical protein ORO03_02275, partial [Alphaproteobacteria bacterium]|nr:hypothetical protein [Alphaproteobacteria bacterium]
TYIEGTGIGVQTSASSFNGALTLVSNGGGIAGAGAVLGSNTGGIMVSTNLSSGAGGGANSDLSLLDVGTRTGYGIMVGGAQLNSGSGKLTLRQSGKLTATTINLNQSQLIATGDINILSDGSTENNAIVVIKSTLTSTAGDINMINTSVLASTNAGITLMSGELVTNAVRLQTSRNNRVNLKTGNSLLTLFINGNIANVPNGNIEIITGRLNIHTGTAAMNSADVNGTILGPGGNILNAPGAAVTYIGAMSGNNATIAVGSGSFTVIGKPTSASLTLTAQTGYSELGLGSSFEFSGSGTSRGMGGLTITGSSGSALTGIGIIAAGTVAISGVTATSPAGKLTYIEGTGIGVQTSASSFNGALTLVSNGGGIAGA